MQLKDEINKINKQSQQIHEANLDIQDIMKGFGNEVDEFLK